MKYHPLSKYFPMLPPTEFEKLKESIQQIGQLEPITLYQGQILDGRNRYEACMALGIKPKTREFTDGVEPLEFVFAANVRRRHLSEAQKVQIDFDIHGQPEPSVGGRPETATAVAVSPSRTYKQIARDLGVSDETVSRIAEVQDDEEIKEELRAGKISARKAVTKRMGKVADKAKIEPTKAGMYAREPATKLIVEKMQEYAANVEKWVDEASLDKIDPKAHTPFLIELAKRIDKANKQWLEKLEAYRDDGQ